MSSLSLELMTIALTSYADIAHLEHKVEDLEAQVRKLSIGSATDLRTQDVELEGQTNSWEPLEQVDSALSTTSTKALDDIPEPASDYFSRRPIDIPRLDIKHDLPGSMSIYRGRTTGVEIMRSLLHLCDNFVGFSLDDNHPATKMVSALDYQAPFEKLPMVASSGSFYSPAHLIRRWIDLAFDEAFVLWHFIDREFVNDNVQRLLETGHLDRDGPSNDYIGLLHSIIALGQRHDSTLVKLERNQSHSEESRG